ncbi:neutral trehalase, partial [Ramicandelaber brevisporus]
RRGSHDSSSTKPRKFLINVEETVQAILAQEDTDGDMQITVKDMGPKVLKVGTADSQGFNKYDIRGTYMLANLLQELALAKDYGRRYIIIDEARLNENPVSRLSRMIRYQFWDGLTRRMDANGIEIICNDPKNRGADNTARIYVPYNDDIAYEYYCQVSRDRPHLGLQVVRLPEKITDQFVKDINTKPGILALALHRIPSADPADNSPAAYEPLPFVVPGGRYNEMYGWDSYFEALGLLNDGRLDLAQPMVDHFIYEIEHYGKILNANRSYYLVRSQPPFLTDMALSVYRHLPANTADENKKWLSNAMRAAVKEYHTVWMAEPRLDKRTGLSRFRPGGLGIPPETESTHFDHVLMPHANKIGVTLDEYKDMYNAGTAVSEELDEYFVHDRAVRESGHDTSYRLDKRCADLATIDLNSLLYKYEMDIGNTVRDMFGDKFECVGPDGVTIVQSNSAEWFKRAEDRVRAIDKYCWNEEVGLYFDYDTKQREQSGYESVTGIYALWAQCVPPHRAGRVVETILQKFEVMGGLVCGTEESRGPISLDRPNRQWDYPYGWAPHQIMAWQGLCNYGFQHIAQKVAYRWLLTITRAFVDFNGVVPEKFDVVEMTHLFHVEYGNVGTDFKLVPREGFGWMNSSYQLGLTYLTQHMRRALGTLTPTDVLFNKLATPIGPLTTESTASMSGASSSDEAGNPMAAAALASSH